MRTIAGVAIALTLGLGATALAQSNYPDKPIRILVGFSAGVAPDVTSRLFGDKFNETWAKGVVVENVTGAGGNLALAQAAKATPDGYTLVMGGNASLVINPNLMKLGYDPLKDFAYITQVFIVPNLVVVPPEVPAKTIQELIALAKAKPDYFVAGHAGVGTSQHLGGELFMAMTGVKFQQVPYRGTTQILPDLLGGRLNLFFGNISNCLPLVREGKLRAFAVTSRKRSPQIPELPTMEELGFPGYEATAWFGLMAPAGTPASIVEKLADAVAAASRNPEVIAALRAQGIEPAANRPPAFAAFIRDQLELHRQLVKDIDLKVSE
jgi:tripartite-type tricarboxylate transporter receptor subunit TctC